MVNMAQLGSALVDFGRTDTGHAAAVESRGRTTFLEHTDIYLAYGHYYLQLARSALPAPGETKSNVEIFRLLGKQRRFRDACFDDSEDQMIEALLRTDSPYFAGITLERLERERPPPNRVSEMWNCRANIRSSSSSARMTTA
jgi:hypothetical protein